MEYDLVIVGGGCAGYPAAVYAARFNLRTLVIAKEQGGLITTTDSVENYPGFNSITGPELALKFEDQVRFNNVEIENDVVSSIEEKGDSFVVKTDFLKKEYLAKSVLIATGSKHRHLGAPGEVEFSGKGVSYCATCDAGFFKGKTVGIIGGSDSAIKEAMILANLASKVYMFVRSYLKGEPANIKQLKSFSNIEVITGVNVKEIQGENKVTNVVLDNEYNGSKNVDLDGLFIAIGHLPQSELAKDLGIELNQRGEIKCDRFGKTNVEGVFAAGDVTDIEWKQAIVSAAQGSMAAYEIYNYINSKK